jgi:ribonuclease Z
MSGLRVVFLGTSSAKPTLSRGLPAVALILDGVLVLFDCGEGTQLQFTRAGLRPSRLVLLCISHFHGDHINGIPGLLSTMNLDQHADPVTVMGPVGLKSYFRELRRLGIFQPRFPLTVLELDNKEREIRMDGFRVVADRVEHSLETWGFRFEEDSKPGRFNLDAARALGIPMGPLYGQLQHGEIVTLEDGRVIQPGEVLGAQRAGRVVAYVTDTRPCETALRLGQDADLLIHEATYARDMADQAAERRHSTSTEAAHIAARAGARKLVLTHLSPKYTDLTALIGEAREVFPNTQVAKDLVEIEILPRE